MICGSRIVGRERRQRKWQRSKGIIAQAVKGRINRSDAETACRVEDIQLNDPWNRLAVRIAHGFVGGSMSFEHADAAMNAINREMIEEAVRVGKGHELPQPAYAIYEAFDAGEFDRGNGEDPVEKYTKPALLEILRLEDPK